MIKPEKMYNTAVEATLEVIGGKWKPVILFHLTFGKKRNHEFRSLIPAITQKMLTQHLRELEEEGVILRVSYNQVPPKSRVLVDILRLESKGNPSSDVPVGRFAYSEKYEGKAVILANPLVDLNNS